MHIKLEQLDADGAIRETAEAAGIDRASFLKKGVAGGAGLVGGSILLAGFPSLADAQISTRKSARNDVKIGNYALTLEFLEAEFYEVANRNKPFRTPDYQVFSQVVGAHEAAHVRFLRRALGSAAVKKPRFEFGAAVNNPDTFAATAQVLEDTGVQAYLGQAGNIAQRAVLGAAGTIVTVEARHAAWIRFLNQPAGPTPAQRPAPAAFDKPASERTILRAVTGTGFIQS